MSNYGYTIYSGADKRWSYNYGDECFERHESIGVAPYIFTDLALAKKCLEEQEDEDAFIYDNAKQIIVS